MPFNNLSLSNHNLDLPIFGSNISTLSEIPDFTIELSSILGEKTLDKDGFVP
tara:strand:+ start:538 stop:693 length:156 start_codon:yes stop_codon:yes gene_type:complete